MDKGVEVNIDERPCMNKRCGYYNTQFDQNCQASIDRYDNPALPHCKKFQPELDKKEDRMYIYVESKPGLYTIGFYTPNGEWIPESDCIDKVDAVNRVALLNGNDDSNKQKIKKSLNLIYEYGGIDGSHHKQWVLDQLVRILSVDYQEWVKKYEEGEDGPQTYLWERGVIP